MIIPLGHDQTEVRRLPWVTFTIMGLCVLVHLLVAFGPGMSETEIGQSLSEAVEYWMTCPYLEIPPRLQEEMLPGFPRDDFDTWREVLRQNAGSPPSESTIAREQIELNEMVEQGFAGMEELPLRKYGLVPSRASILTLFTHMFLHVGWLHLLGNLFFLYLTGPFIEDVWGRPMFLGFYLLAGLASGGLFALRYADLTIPLVGASGAIAGCMGAFLIRYWHINIKFFYWIGFFFRGTFKAPAWLMLPLWLLGEIFSATMMDSLDPSGRGGGTAFWAHVWGFLFGIVVALSIRFLKIEQRFIHHAIEAKTTVVNNAVVAEALAAQDAGRTDEAIASLTSELRQSPGNSEAVLALWSLALGASRVAEAVPAMKRLLREEVRAGDLDLAMTHRAELSEYAPDAQVDPMVDLRLAEYMLKDEQEDQAAALLQNALEHVSPDVSPGLLTRLARLACRAEVGIGLVALEKALAHPELPEDAREEFEGKKKELASRQPVTAQPMPDEQGGPTIEADGIAIPGFEPTSICQPVAEPEAVPGVSSGFVPDAGGDVPMDPAAFDAAPDVPGVETVVDQDQAIPGAETTDSPWQSTVPVMGGDVPAVELSFEAVEVPDLPSFEMADASFPTEIPIMGNDAPAAEPESLAVGPASLRTAGTLPVPDQAPVPASVRPTASAKKLELHQAEPLSIDDKRMTLHIEGRGTSALSLDKVQAISTAVIRPPGRPALIVIDLLLDPPWATGVLLRVVRMRTGRLNPSKVVPEAPNSARALRMMIEKLLAGSQAIPLPDTLAVKGKPFREFTSLRQYEQEILQAG